MFQVSNSHEVRLRVSTIRLLPSDLVRLIDVGTFARAATSVVITARVVTVVRSATGVGVTTVLILTTLILVLRILHIPAVTRSHAL